MEKWIAKIFIYWPTKNPGKAIGITFIFLSLFIPGLFQFEQQSDARLWFRTSDPLIKTLDKFEKKFGNDESIVFAIYNSNGIYNKKTLELVRYLTDKAWQLPQVIRVESLTNHNITVGKDDEIQIGPLFDEDESLTQSYILERSQVASKSRRIPNFLVSKNQKMTLIYARLIPSVVQNPIYHNIYYHAEKIIKSIKTEDVQIFLAGEAAISTAFRKISRSDLMVIIPLLLLLIVLYLYYVFRSLFVSIFPLFITTASVVVTLGLGFYAGVKFSNILAVLPVILVSISVADSVHFLSTYFEERAKGVSSYESSIQTLKKNLMPTFLTSFSTTIGFLGLATTELIPIRDLGLLASFGSLAAWFFSIFFLTGLVNLVKIKTPPIFYKKRDNNTSLAKRVTSFVEKNHGKIIIFFLALTVTCTYLSSKNIVNANPYSYFKKGTIYRTSNDFIMNNFGGVSGPEFFIKSNKNEGVKEIEFLKKVETLENWIKQNSKVGNTISIIDIIKEVNKTLHSDNEAFYKIPDTRQEVSEYLLLYTMGLPSGSDLNNRISVNQDSLRLSVLWEIYDSVEWRENVKKIIDKSRGLGLDIEVTGKLNLYQRMINYVVSTFITSLTLGIGLIAILLMLVFRSVKIGLLSMIPNLLPLVIGGAFMYIVGFELNVGTILVGSTCLGIAVDDTIHFLTKYYQMTEKKKSHFGTILEIYQSTGKALIITTIILVSGFSLYILGSFVPNIYFGILSAFVLSTALITDLILLPAVLFWISNKRRGKA